MSKHGSLYFTSHFYLERGQLGDEESKNRVQEAGERRA